MTLSHWSDIFYFQTILVVLPSQKLFSTHTHTNLHDLLHERKQFTSTLKSLDSSHRPYLLLTADVFNADRAREIEGEEIIGGPEAPSDLALCWSKTKSPGEAVEYLKSAAEFSHETNISRLFLPSLLSFRQVGPHVCFCNKQERLWRLGLGVNSKCHCYFLCQD